MLISATSEPAATKEPQSFQMVFSACSANQVGRIWRILRSMACANPTSSVSLGRIDEMMILPLLRDGCSCWSLACAMPTLSASSRRNAPLTHPGTETRLKSNQDDQATDPGVLNGCVESSSIFSECCGMAPMAEWAAGRLGRVLMKRRDGRDG